jgi:O-antigen/teichoic acid export membrane protein
MGAGLGFAVQVLFARWAGPEHYGVYSYAMGWTALLSTFSGLGFQHAIVRFIPEYERAGMWGHLRGVVRRSEQFILGMSLVLALFGCAVVAGISFLNETYSTYVTPLLLGFGLILPRALSTLQTRMCVARQQMRIAYVLPNLSRPLLMIIGAATLVLFLDRSLNATSAVLLAGLPTVPIWLIQRWAFHDQLPPTFEQTDATYNSKKWLHTAFPMFLIIGFSVLLSKTDLLMIGLLSSAEQVGLYKVASKTALLTLFPLFAVKTVVAPRIAEAHAGANQKQLQELASMAARWMFGGAFVVAVGLALFSGLILGLFGPIFIQGRPAMLILIVGHVANAGTGAVGPLLTMTGHQVESAKVFGLCAGLNIVLNGIGIFFFGIMGAALATATSTLLWNVSLYRIVSGKLRVSPSIIDAPFTDT